MPRKPKEKRKVRPSFGVRALQTSCLVSCLLVAAMILALIIWGVRNTPQPVEAIKVIEEPASTMRPTLVPSPVQGDGKLSWKIMFMADAIPSIMNVDGSNVHFLEDIWGAKWTASTPKWAPNRNQIAYTSGGANNHLALYVAHAKGTLSYSYDINDAMYPSWSPDGKQIVVQVGADDRFSKIYVMNVDNTLHGFGLSDGAYPSWSPDGKYILFQANRNGKSCIYFMDTDGTHQVQLTKSGSEGWPVWSPDGQSIAFVSGTEGPLQLYIMRADGSNPVKLTGLGENYMPSWSPDSRYIAFYSFRNSKFQIYIINADGSNEHRITNSRTNSEPVWIP